MLVLRLRRLRALRRAQRRDAYHGLLIGLTMMAFVVGGSLLFEGHAAPGWLVLIGSVTCGALVVIYLLVPWDGVPSQMLLLLPGAWLLGLLVLSMQVGAFASNFVGLTVLAFLFGGITQHRWQ